MGSSISAIYDDYDDYEAMCKLLNKTPVDIRALTWRKEMDEWEKKYNVRGNINLYRAIRESLNK